MPPIRRRTGNPQATGRCHLLNVDSSGRSSVRMSGACRCPSNIQFTFESSPCIEGSQQNLTVSPLQVFRRNASSQDTVVLRGLAFEVNHPVSWGNSVFQVFGFNRQSGESVSVPLSDPILLSPGCKERIEVPDELLASLIYSEARCPVSTTSVLPVFELQWIWFGGKCAPKTDHANLARVGLCLSGIGTVNYSRFLNTSVTHLRTRGG